MKISHPLVIFAGGKSSRMGRDKALLPFGSSPTLTEFQLEKFAPFFEHIYVGCKDKNKFDFKANFIEDLEIYEDSAPYVGLISAFEQLQSDTICVISVDAPFFNAEHFKKLLKENNQKYNALVAQSPTGIQPLCAVYKKSTLPYLLQLTNEKRYPFKYLYEKISVKFIPFEDEKIFTNLNTPHEYEKAML